MKIAIVTVQVPFITGGAEVLTHELRNELLKRNMQADIITVPFKWYPFETLINCMLMGRMIDLSEVNGEKIDLVIAMKFPAYYLKHPNKVIWLMHQHRQAYDLWGTEYSDISSSKGGELLKNTIVMNDNVYMREAKKIYTIADNVTRRLKKFNDLDAVTLYPPPKNCDRLHCKSYENFIFYPSRIDSMKRQRLLVESARYLKSGATILIAGGGAAGEVAYLESLIRKYKLQDKVKLLGFITEEEKIDYYSRCLAVYFGAYDEDYGFITLEAYYSKKPVIIHNDAGGPLEFVEDEKNGFIVDTAPEAIALRIDDLVANRQLAPRMGEQGHQTIQQKNITWDHIIKVLTA